jgi:hypothetical protein
MAEANRVLDARARRFSSMGKNTPSTGMNVAEENAGDRLSATTRAKVRNVPFPAPLAGAVTTVAFAGQHSLYLSAANGHLKHCLCSVHEFRRTEGPFKLAQLAALVVFLLLGVFATRRFQNEQLRTA